VLEPENPGFYYAPTTILQNSGHARRTVLRRSFLKSTDLLAGVAIAAVEIPVALAYAELAGFPPVVGLYASILPLVAYAILGSSPQLIVGPDAATCALVAASLAPLSAGNPLRHVELSITLSLVVGSLCVIGGMLRLGGLANFLSRPILVGFLNGMGLVIISGQLGKLCGIPVRTDTGFFLRIADFVSKIGQTHFPTLMVGTLTLVLIYLVGRLAPRVPGPLVGVCGGIAMMALLDAEKWPVSRMGAVPAGFPLPHLRPDFFSDAARLLPDAVGIALICFCSSMITAKSFAVRNRYEVQADREFMALGRPGPLGSENVELVLRIGVFGDDRLQERIVTDRTVSPGCGPGRRNS